MTSPLPLPDWVPWWVHLVILLGALLFLLLFLLMPFSVFGVKARLEGVEARLDEIQGEIRSLALRLPEPIEPGLDYVTPTSVGAPAHPSPRHRATPTFHDPTLHDPSRPACAGRTEPRF